MPGLIFVCVPHHSMTHIYVYNDSQLWVLRISYVCHDSHLSVECVMDQRFKDVISQQKKSAFERGKGTVHLPMYLRTHTLTYTYAYAHAHTHICTHIPPTANRIKIEPETNGSNHSEYLYHRTSQFCWDLRTTHPNIVLKNNCISWTYIYIYWKGCE